MKSTQNQRLLAYLEKYGSITQLEATIRLRILRLAARIAELEAVGHQFRHEMVYGKDPDGNPVHYMRYWKVA